MQEGYACNFLHNVVCRVDFPVDLKLKIGIPSGFQERIKQEFPKSDESFEVEGKISAQEKPTLEVGEMVRRWHFYSRDRSRLVTLRSKSLGLDVKEYISYDDFKRHLQLAFEALIEEYAPTVFTRLGLRYINIIEPKDGVPTEWNGLINSTLTAHLRFKQEGELLKAFNELTIQRELGRVTVRYGMDNPDFPEPIARKRFVLDIDSYTGEDLEPNEVLRRLDVLHGYAEDLFQESIEEGLRGRMKEGECL